MRNINNFKLEIREEIKVIIIIIKYSKQVILDLSKDDFIYKDNRNNKYFKRTKNY